MRILHLGTDSFGGHGGIALYNRELVAALATHPSVDEVVVLPRIIVKQPEDLPRKVTFVPAAAKGGLAYLRAVHATRAAKFDIVICAHLNLLPIARLVTWKPWLLIYGIDAWKPPRGIVPNRGTGVAAVISISHITLDRFTSWSGYTGLSRVLPNSIRADRYQIRPKDPHLLARYGVSGKRVLLTVGRLASAERYKGFDEVLEILPQLPRDVVYLIAGGGDDAGRLQQKAVSLGVADRVIFTGLFSDSDKQALYSLADVFAMPSRGEGFGFVFLEAMACGVPVIASRMDGGREAVLNGALGQLVDPSNPADVRTAVEEALQNGERCIPAGLDYFSFENFERRTHAIIDELT